MVLYKTPDAILADILPCSQEHIKWNLSIFPGRRNTLSAGDIGIWAGFRPAPATTRQSSRNLTGKEIDIPQVQPANAHRRHIIKIFMVLPVAESQGFAEFVPKPLCRRDSSYRERNSAQS